jgi:hypothetical protein
MITEYGCFDATCVPKDFIGLSTDVKPVNVPNTSSFYEMDTKSMFLFDAENGRWLKQ